MLHRICCCVRMMVMAKVWLLAALSMMAMICRVSAQESPTAVSVQGTRDLEVLGAVGIGVEGGTSLFNWDIVTAGVRFSKVLTGPHGHGRLRGNFEYGFDVMPVFVLLNPQRVYGGGFDPIVARWNFRQRVRSAAYFEVVAGSVFTVSNVPSGDTSSFNFVPKAGAGWQLFASPERSLDLSLQFWHLSNAFIGRENPSLNGLQFVVGYHWFKLRKPKANAVGVMPKRLLFNCVAR
jgi:lipid A 3-O-deacylase PagL